MLEGVAGELHPVARGGFGTVDLETELVDLEPESAFFLVDDAEFDSTTFVPA
jgi:hypothetical protein